MQGARRLEIRANAAPQQWGRPRNESDVANNYLITSGTGARPNTKISVKGDHVFSAKSRIRQLTATTELASFPAPMGQPVARLFCRLQRHRPKLRCFPRKLGLHDLATVFNHFYGGGKDWKENHDPPQATVRSGIHWKDKICLGNVPDCDQNLVRFTFSNGYNAWTGPANNGSENFIKMFADDLTIIKGRHTWKIGGQTQFQYYNGFGRQCVAGCVGWDFKHTGRPGDTNFTTAGGSPIASMLLGYANSGQIDTIRYIGQQWPSFAGFVQDDWRVRPNLMLNLGSSLGDNVASHRRK